MLDFRQVGANLDHFRKQLSRRPTFDVSALDRVKTLWEERSTAIKEKQELETKRNASNQEMQRIMKSGTNEEKAKARDEMKELSNRVKALDTAVTEGEGRLSELMLDNPHVPHETGADRTGEQDQQDRR